REASVVACALALVLTVGCRSTCQSCQASCDNGLLTACAVATQPSCGAEPVVSFCPNGCAVDAAQCNPSGVDGATGVGCSANSAVIQEGVLKAQGSAFVAIASLQETRVVIATSASAACATTRDAGASSASSSGAVLALSIPSNFAGDAKINSAV